MRRLLASALLAVLASQSAAQDLRQMAYYRAEIGSEDFRSSRGARLTDFGAVLQQDRANVHRFGIRHAGDDIDPVFGDRAQRARLPELYRQHGRAPGFEDMVRRGEPFRLSVFVCGYGDNIAFIALAGDGEDHSGCF